MTEKLSNVTLSYTTKTGEHKTKTIKVEQGLVINFNNKNGNGVVDIRERTRCKANWKIQIQFVFLYKKT